MTTPAGGRHFKLYLFLIQEISSKHESRPRGIRFISSDSRQLTIIGRCEGSTLSS